MLQLQRLELKTQRAFGANICRKPVASTLAARWSALVHHGARASWHGSKVGVHRLLHVFPSLWVSNASQVRAVLLPVPCKSMRLLHSHT